MAVFNLEWDNSPIVSDSNVISQRVSHRIPEISNNPAGTSTWSTSGLTPANDMAKSVFAAGYDGPLNTLHEFKVESICTTGGPTIGSNGIQQAIVFSCLSGTLLPYDAIITNPAGNGSNQLQFTVNVVNTDIDSIRVILRTTIGNNVVGDQTVSASQLGPTHVEFEGLTPDTSYYTQVIYFATVNGEQVESNACTNTSGSTDEPVEGNPNLIFSWNKSNGDVVDLTFDSDLQKGINGTYSQINWGDGIINSLRTHTYTSNSDFTVSINNSDATIIFLKNQNVTSFTKTPFVTQSINIDGNQITSFGSLDAPNLTAINMSHGNISTSIDFTGIENVEDVSFAHNSIPGYFDFSMLPNVNSLNMGFNLIDSHSPLSGNTTLNYVDFQSNNISTMPVFTGNTAFTTIIYSNNPITGVLNLSTNHNLNLAYFANVNIPTPPNLSTNTALQAVDFTNSGMTGTLNVSTCLNLGVVVLDGNNLTDVIGFENTLIFSAGLRSNQFPVSRINTFLQSVNSQGLSGYVFHSEGQTPIAVPFGIGATAKANLISRGYSVTTD